MDRYEEQGYRDAVEGITACPFGVPEHARRWAVGYDRAVDAGLTTITRFGGRGIRRAH